MIINPKIFKAYDIRGEWNKEWDAEFVRQIGYALALNMKPKVVAIGRDMRNSGEEIFQALSSAFTESGVNVLDLGLCGTELTYFASSFLPEADLALMITASHNPLLDNGLKVTLKNSITLGLDSGLSEIRDLALAEMKITRANTGKITSFNLWPQYKAHVFKLASKIAEPNFAKPIKVVIDAGNGIGGYMFDLVLKDLPVTVTKLFWNPDGNFPNHAADPFVEKNVEKLKKKVVEEKADLGIAYDGDSDRIFFVDETGRYLPGYYTAALLSRFMLSRSPVPQDEIIVYDSRYYWATQDVTATFGASCAPCKVGHTLIKAKMREVNSLFSAECSGHVFYRENNFAESSMLTTLLMLKIVSQQGKLSELAEPLFKQYPISGEINFRVNGVLEVLNQIKKRYSSTAVDEFDGVSVQFPDWRFNLRGSNTQPLLRLNIEGKNIELVQNKVEELKNWISGTLE